MQDIGSEVWDGRGRAGLDTGIWDGATRSCSKASIPLGNCSVSSAVSATVICLVWLGCQSDSPLYDILQCTQNLSNSIIWKVFITRRPQGNARGHRWSSWTVVTSTHVYSTPTRREQGGTVSVRVVSSLSVVESGQVVSVVPQPSSSVAIWLINGSGLGTGSAGLCRRVGGVGILRAM
jgi:hypothetical protein